MGATVARMTEQKLKEMIETTVERKLLELLGDPDEGLALRRSVRERLLRQKRAIASGKRGEPFAEVVKRLGCCCGTAKGKDHRLGGDEAAARRNQDCSR